MSYTWNNDAGKQEDALNILRKGIKANPARSVVRLRFVCIYCLNFLPVISSFLLNLAYIEIQEIKKNKSETVIAFDNFLTVLRANLEVIGSQVNADKLSAESNNAASAIGSTPATTGSTEIVTKLNTSANVQGANKTSSKSKSLAEWRKEYGLVWIMYMRAARRVISVRKSRDIFGEARKDRWVPWEVWEAAGL
jgi:cleavage stimulation factor subunit 3